MPEPKLLNFDIDEFASLSFERLTNRLDEQVITYFLEQAGALWLHSGNPADPHAELTAGGCSNGFVDTVKALKYANFCLAAGKYLADKLRKVYDGPVDWVIGSDHAGATISFAVAVWLGAKHDFTVKYESPDGKVKKQIWNRTVIPEGEYVLQCEELMTTLTTLGLVREGIIEGNPYSVNFVPNALTFVHRADLYEFEGGGVLYGVHYDIEKWAPDDCPLCKAGSKKLRPKTNWAELTGSK